MSSFKVISLGFLVVGTLIDPTVIWLLADLFMGLMALPNIIALVVLAPLVKQVLHHYDESKKSGRMTWPDLDSLKRRN